MAEASHSTVAGAGAFWVRILMYARIALVSAHALQGSDSGFTPFSE